MANPTLEDDFYRILTNGNCVHDDIEWVTRAVCRSGPDCLRILKMGIARICAMNHVGTGEERITYPTGRSLVVIAHLKKMIDATSTGDWSSACIDDSDDDHEADGCSDMEVSSEEEEEEEWEPSSEGEDDDDLMGEDGELVVPEHLRKTAREGQEEHHVLANVVRELNSNTLSALYELLQWTLEDATMNRNQVLVNALMSKNRFAVEWLLATFEFTRSDLMEADERVPFGIVRAYNPAMSVLKRAISSGGGPKGAM